MNIFRIFFNVSSCVGCSQWSGACSRANTYTSVQPVLTCENVTYCICLVFCWFMSVLCGADLSVNRFPCSHKRLLARYDWKDTLAATVLGCLVNNILCLNIQILSKFTGNDKQYWKLRLCLEVRWQDTADEAGNLKLLVLNDNRQPRGLKNMHILHRRNLSLEEATCHKTVRRRRCDPLQLSTNTMLHIHKESPVYIYCQRESGVKMSWVKTHCRGASACRLSDLLSKLRADVYLSPTLFDVIKLSAVWWRHLLSFSLLNIHL